MPNNLFRKGMAAWIIVLFMGVSIVPSTANVININSITKDEFTLIPLKSGKTLYVGGSGPNNYTKIQDAVDDASDGDTVFVYDDSSPYNENIVIEEKTIHLLGEDRNTTIIDMDFTDNGIRIENCDNGGSFSGFTFQNCIEYYGGFEIRRSSNYVIKNNIIKNNANGIQLLHSHNCIISNNSLCSNDNAGIYIECGSYNLISDNYIASNSKKGIYMDFTINNIIKNNFVELNKNIGIATHWCEYNTFTGNIIQENGLNPDGLGCGLFLHCSMANNIKYNFIRNNSIGIYGFGSYRDIICNNQIEFNSISGIYSVGLRDNTIEKNNFIGNLCHATFEERGSRNVDYWDRNFWERLINFGPYFIKGKYYPDEYDDDYFTVYEIDWNPAKKPYDIGDEDINENLQQTSQQSTVQQTQTTQQITTPHNTQTTQQTIIGNFLNRLIRR